MYLTLLSLSLTLNHCSSPCVTEHHSTITIPHLVPLYLTLVSLYHLFGQYASLCANVPHFVSLYLTLASLHLNLCHCTSLYVTVPHSTNTVPHFMSLFTLCHCTSLCVIVYLILISLYLNLCHCTSL